MLYEVFRYFANGWIRSHFIDPQFHFTYYGFGWVSPWPGNGMYWHFAALGILAMMIALGLFYRIATILFCLGFLYVFLLEQAYYLNHFYLVCLLSLIAIVLPANCAYSLDVLRRPELRRETVPAWTLWLLRFQIGVVYFFGGLAKLDSDWLDGAFIRIVFSKRPDFPILGPFFQEEWMVMAFVYGGLLLDLFIVPLLMWNRTRIPAYVLVILFHATNAQLFHIGIFPLFMVAASMLFFPADSLKPEQADEDASRKKTKRNHKRSELPSKERPPESRIQWAVITGLLIYGAFQILMPLRHLLYPGNPNWTEEGHRFAWHMKLRAKSSECKFVAVDEQGNAIDVATYEDILNEKQRRTMAGRPDMILQFAHFLTEKLQQAGHSGVKIYARSMVSLNGRKPQPMIDPNANLAAQNRNLKHADWILPLITPLPSQESR
ncbi:MAG: HTTM domain-containing protein [Planctomycetaceae bacterium]